MFIKSSNHFGCLKRDDFNLKPSRLNRSVDVGSNSSIKALAEAELKASSDSLVLQNMTEAIKVYRNR